MHYAYNKYIREREIRHIASSAVKKTSLISSPEFFSIFNTGLQRNLSAVDLINLCPQENIKLNHAFSFPFNDILHYSCKGKLTIFLCFISADKRRTWTQEDSPALDWHR